MQQQQRLLGEDLPPRLVPRPEPERDATGEAWERLAHREARGHRGRKGDLSHLVPVALPERGAVRDRGTGPDRSADAHRRAAGYGAEWRAAVPTVAEAAALEFAAGDRPIRRDDIGRIRAG